MNKIIDSHKLWINSHRKDGDRANLRNINLSKYDLSKTDLSYADLSYADLSYADLIGCFWGTSGEAIKKIRKDCGENSYYEKLVSLYSEEQFWIENEHGEIK